MEATISEKKVHYEIITIIIASNSYHASRCTFFSLNLLDLSLTPSAGNQTGTQEKGRRCPECAGDAFSLQISCQEV